MLFIYPLENELFGYMQFLFTFGIFLVPFMSLGLPTFIIKFQPYFYKKEGKNNSFLSFALIISIVISFLCVALIFLLRNPFRSILDALEFDVHLISENLYLLLIIGFLQVQVALFTAYLSNHGKVAFPTLVFQLGYKFFLPVVILLYHFDSITFYQSAISLILFLALVLTVLIIYSIKDRVFYITKNILIPKLEKGKEMTSYLLFSSLTSISNLLAFRVDMLMIAALISLDANGIYAKILIIASVIDLPTKIITRTASPEISRSWENKNYGRINSIYQKSSLNLFLLGAFLFLLMWFILDDLILISSNPASFENGKMIFLFLSIGKLVDLIARVNKSVIGYSPSYKINFFLVAFLGVSNIILNYLLIGRFNIIGAAVATALSLILYNAIKFTIIFIKYKMQPLTKELIIIMGIGVFTYFLMWMVPTLENVYLDLILKSTLVCVFYGVPVLLLKPSKDLNDLITSALQKVKI